MACCICSYMYTYILHMHFSQIFMWHFKDNKDLLGVAFIDTDIYSLRAVSLRNFIVVGDIHHSIQLLKYKVNTYVCDKTMKWNVLTIGESEDSLSRQSGNTWNVDCVCMLNICIL